MNYNELFNPVYINENMYNKIMQNHHNNQVNEIGKMLKALDDFIKTSKNIAPEYRESAFNAWIIKIYEEYFK